MTEGLRVLGRALRHVNHRGYVYIWTNIAWAVLSLPVITAPAAWAGLVRMSQTAYTSPTADFSDFWVGFRENLQRGALMGVLNLAIMVVNIINFQAYRFQTGVGFDFLRAIWLFTLAIWFGVQFYMWPIFYRMQEPTMLGSMRNAVVMMLMNPGFTLLIWIGVAVIAILSTILFPAWLLLTGGTLAAIANNAVLNRLSAAGFDMSTGGGEENLMGV
jgi:uncharacterized membrane protein YesL